MVCCAPPCISDSLALRGAKFAVMMCQQGSATPSVCQRPATCGRRGFLGASETIRFPAGSRKRSRVCFGFVGFVEREEVPTATEWRRALTELSWVLTELLSWVNIGGAEVVADGAELLDMVQPHDRTECRWSCHEVAAVRGIFQCSDARLQQRRRADPAQDFAAGTLDESTRFAERARHRSLWSGLN